MTDFAFRPFGQALALASLLAFAAIPAAAHPHAFVDGGVDFVFDDDGVLKALKMTWLIDEFETLYLVSSYGIALNEKGGLDESDRLEMKEKLEAWADTVDGWTHLSIEGEQVPLGAPDEFDATLLNGKLKMTLSRGLKDPVSLNGKAAEVALYEPTYFYDLSAVLEPKILGSNTNCGMRVIPFDPGKLLALQATLIQLEREQTPEIENVGALFADRIVLECA